MPEPLQCARVKVCTFFLSRRVRQGRPVRLQRAQALRTIVKLAVTPLGTSVRHNARTHRTLSREIPLG